MRKHRYVISSDFLQKLEPLKPQNTGLCINFVFFRTSSFSVLVEVLPCDSPIFEGPRASIPTPFWIVLDLISSYLL